MLTCSTSAVSTNVDLHVQKTVCVANFVSFSHGVVEGKSYGRLDLHELTHQVTYQSRSSKPHAQDCPRVGRRHDLVGCLLQPVHSQECLQLGWSLTKD